LSPLFTIITHLAHRLLEIIIIKAGNKTQTSCVAGMSSRLKKFTNGIHFRLVMLISGVALTLVVAQLATDTASETRKAQSERLEEALAMTNVVARSLEKQFEYFELDEIEGILESVRARTNVTQVLAVDANRTFFLDGDRLTPTLLAAENIADQTKALESGETHFSKTEEVITVAEPLNNNGGVIGSLMIRYKNPSFSEIAWPIVTANLSSSVPILILGILLAGLLSRQITMPLSRLSKAANMVAKGDLEVVLPIDGPNEVRSLGNSVSDMIKTLRSNIEQIYELAYVDRTTQLPNREFFRKELTRAIRRCVRQKTTGALLFVDLDGFKRVNDTFGHDVGDELLGQFSDRLANVLRAEDLIGFDSVSSSDDSDDEEDGVKKSRKQVLARLGGDEFTVLLSEIREATDAATVSQRIIAAVSEPFDINGSKINIGASIGIAAFPQDGSDYQTILKSADMAMYQSKDEGKNTYRFFSESLNQEATRRVEIEADLRAALDEGDQLELYYQPKISCENGRPKSVEALIRWKHPEKGMVQPLEFIRIAEDCGLILPLGKWVLQEACRQIVIFAGMGLDLSIAVNISAAQFERPDLAQTVIDVLEETGADPSRLELELTESMAMQNPGLAIRHIEALKNLGVRFAIDDFGTGYSNLSQLSKLPFDVFKIDRSFVEMLDGDEDEHGRAIVRTILAMANSLNYETVAEGVETLKQYEFLRDHGCTFVQGYYFARPLPANEFVEWMNGWKPKTASSSKKVVKLKRRAS